jgi:ubiquinone/menaquinone biosynthesis C-methylase UbiE
MQRDNHEAINRAFSKQAVHFDEDDLKNIILQDLRAQIYRHVDRFLKPASRILELNAGTGIDATRFVRAGHAVHATDLSDGMIAELLKKKSQHGMDRLTVQQLSFDNLEMVTGKNYDLVFSNFGGLNCINNLSLIGDKLRTLLAPGGFVTWVIMPVVSPWEVATILRGNRYAFRRWSRDGTLAQLEGERFQTWYHNVASIKRFLPHFELIRTEGIASLSPPPYKSNFPNQHPAIYKMLRRVDESVATIFPFNRWADHVIVTMQLKAGS